MAVPAPKNLMAAALDHPNRIAQSLRAGRFFWTIEFVASSAHVLHDDLVTINAFGRELAERPEVAGFSVTDRVHSNQDPDPVTVAVHVREHSGNEPLIHWAGKDRDLEDLNETLKRMQGHRLENLLLLSGDKLKDPPTDRRSRYLESVPAICVARQAMPDLIIAAALNPFKYREEEAMAQYLKLGKKVAAGADFIVTQIGFDINKYEEALFWMDTRGYRVPMVANVMALSARRARFIRRHTLAGVTITDSYHRLLEEEERLMPERAKVRVTRRLALQILGLRMLGYSGVQLTAIHSVETLVTLLHQIDYLAERCPDRVSWNKAWAQALSLSNGVRANPVPEAPWYMVDRHVRHAPRRDLIKYVVMEGVHRVLFDKGAGARFLGWLVRDVRRQSWADRWLERFERMIKAPLFGCDSCGLCRLAATQYVCPETCPKGLANGACGGTHMNRCEFEDRECIHSRKYRIAKDAGILEQLERWLIPAVPKAIRHTSSWPPHFRGEGPAIQKVDMRDYGGCGGIGKV
jgi:methylenetetrahydrofolate reductase (NADPH)